MARKRGRPVKSLPYSWSTGAKFPINLDFLKELIGQSLEKLKIRITGSITTGVGVEFLAADAGRLIERLHIRDRKRDRWNVTGMELAAFSQRHFRETYHAGPSASVGVAATNAAFEYIVEVPFALPSLMRDRDTSMPVVDLLSVGSFELKMAATNPLPGVTINNLVVEVWAYPSKSKDRQAPSRLCVQSYSITKQEDRVDIGGRCVDAFGVAPNPGAAGYASWSAIGEIDSETLELADFPRALLVEEHRRYGAKSVAADDLCVAGTAFPFINPIRKIGEAPRIGSLHYRLSAALPANAVLVYTTIVDRDDELSALHVGAPGVAAYRQMVAQAQVKTLGRGPRRVTTFNPSFAAHLPLKFAGR